MLFFSTDGINPLPLSAEKKLRHAGWDYFVITFKENNRFEQQKINTVQLVMKKTVYYLFTTTKQQPRNLVI